MREGIPENTRESISLSSIEAIGATIGTKKSMSFAKSSRGGPREWIYASDDSFTRGKSAFTALSGTRTFEFAIAPYEDRIEAERQSMNYATPLIAIWQDSSGAEASKSAPTSNTKPSDYIQSCSALELDSEKVFITAFLVQNGNIIARLWNASGNEVTSALQSHPNVPLSRSPNLKIKLSARIKTRLCVKFRIKLRARFKRRLGTKRRKPIVAKYRSQ